MEKADALKIVQDSYGRCLLNGGFWDSFYKHFISSSDKIARMFVNTDMAKQAKLMKTSLNFIIMYGKDPDAAFAKGKLEEVGQIHSRGRVNVSHELYGFWVSSLLKTIKENDAGFSPQTEDAWIQVITPGLNLLKSKY